SHRAGQSQAGMKLPDVRASLGGRGARRIDNGGESGIEIKIDIGDAAFGFAALCAALVADAGAALAAAAVDTQKQLRHFFLRHHSTPGEPFLAPYFLADALGKTFRCVPGFGDTRMEG